MPEIWTSEDEKKFKEWYSGWAKKAGIDQNPDNPLHKYDYRAAFKAGATPEISQEDNLYHWPSEYKADDHPNRYVNGIDTKTGKRQAMPTREELLEEAYKRDVLPPDMKAAYEEAVNRGLVKKPQSWIGKQVQKVTGTGLKREGVSDFSSEFDLPKPFKTGMGMLASTDEAQMVDVIKANNPEAEFQKDEHGNTMVKVPGRDWQYINQPGMSSRDVTNLIAQGAVYLAGGKAAGKIAPKSLPLRALTTGAIEGAASVGLDKAAGMAGSEQGVNLPRAGVTAAAGGVFELAAPVMSGIWRKLTAGGREPTPEAARKILVGFGYEPEDLSDEMVAAFIQKTKQAANPLDAARVAEAESLPVKVPQTKGQITMTAKDQMFEDLASKGAYGEGPETLMRGARQKGDEALRANIPAIQGQLGGGQTVRNQAGELAQRSLVGKANTTYKMVDDAYEVAKKTGGSAPEDVVGKIVKDVSDSFEDYLPHSKMAPDEMNWFLERVGVRDKAGKLIGFKEADVKTLFDWRRRLSKLSANAKDQTESSALRAMRKQFDASLDDAMMTVLKEGDESAVNAWKKAIALRSKYGEVFEADDLVSELIERKGKTLKVAPEAASNFIFGVSDTQMLARPELAREIKKLKSILGETGPEWNSIREEAFLRLAAKGEKGAMTGGEYGFSGVNFKKAVDTMKEKNPEVWNTLFNADERALISRFANLSARLTNPVRGGAQFSNTTVGISNIFQTITNALFMGQKGRALLSRIFPTIYEGIQLGPTAEAARGAMPLVQIPAGTMGGVGAVVGSRQGAE